MTINKVELIKKEITEYLKMENDDDSILITDVFKYASGHSYQLTNYGFRNLSKRYEFMELEAECDVNIRNYSYIDRSIKGLYYVAPSKSKNGFINIHTTDKKFVKWIKLYKNDMNDFIRCKMKKK